MHRAVAAGPGAACRRGFTLIEVMIVVAIVAILAAIALPSYDRYVKKSRARAASADLTALSLNVENVFRRTLSYPAASANTTTTAGTVALLPGWSPAVGTHFEYAATFNADDYVLTASGKTGMTCTLTLTVPHQGETTRAASGADCGFTSW